MELLPRRGSHSGSPSSPHGLCQYSFKHDLRPLWLGILAEEAVWNALCQE